MTLVKLGTDKRKIQSQINTKVVGYDSILDFGKMVVGDKVGNGEPLFVRIDEKKKLAQIYKDKGIKRENQVV